MVSSICLKMHACLPKAVAETLLHSTSFSGAATTSSITGTVYLGFPTSIALHAHLPPAMEREYIPQDTLSNTGTAMLQTTAAGAIIAGVQNTLRKQNVGAMGIITRSGHIIATYGAYLSMQ